MAVLLYPNRNQKYLKQCLASFLSETSSQIWIIWFFIMPKQSMPSFPWFFFVQLTYAKNIHKKGPNQTLTSNQTFLSWYYSDLWLSSCLLRAYPRKSTKLNLKCHAWFFFFFVLQKSCKMSFNFKKCPILSKNKILQKSHT